MFLDPLTMGELGQGMFALWWGAHLLRFPVFDGHPYLYAELELIAPQSVWGALFLLIGAGICFASLARDLRWRRLAMGVHAFSMITMWTAFVRVDETLTSTPAYGSWTFLALGILLILFLRRRE